MHSLNKIARIYKINKKFLSYYISLNLGCGLCKPTNGCWLPNKTMCCENWILTFYPCKVNMKCSSKQWKFTKSLGQWEPRWHLVLTNKLLVNVIVITWMDDLTNQSIEISHKGWLCDLHLCIIHWQPLCGKVKPK
jgi:hypothetical protein